jgi:hypothetical protein
MKKLSLIILILLSSCNELTRPVIKGLNKDPEIKKAVSCSEFQIEQTLLTDKSLCLAVDKSPRMQAMLDHMAQNILTTETGSLLWETKRNNLPYLSDITGVGKKTLEEVSLLNLQKFKKVIRAFLNHSPQNDPTPKKKYFLILNANAKNESFIAIDQEVTLVDLYNLFLHEMFIRQDTKYNLSESSQKLFTTKLTLINNDIKSIHTLSDESELIMTDWEKLLNYQSYIAIRAAFSYMRSVIFQEWIWKYLTPKLETPGHNTNLLNQVIVPIMDRGQCPEVFKEVATRLVESQSALINTFSISYDPETIKFSIANLDKIKEAYEFLKQTDLKIVDNRRVITPCEYMSVPFFTDYIIEAPRTPYVNFDQ